MNPTSVSVMEVLFSSMQDIFSNSSLTESSFYFS